MPCEGDPRGRSDYTEETPAEQTSIDRKLCDFFNIILMSLGDLKMRGLMVLAMVAFVACVPSKPVQPAPVTVPTSRPAAQIVQLAARSLVDDGFEITLSDPASGIVTAKRAKGKTGNSAFVKCRYASGSIAETNMETTITVTVTARGGSAAVVSSSVRATLPGLSGTVMQQAPSDDDCASTGLAESHVNSALKT